MTDKYWLIGTASQHHGIAAIQVNKSVMTPEHFKEFWASTYPETLPIQHLFRYNYASRWFRIHSLPQSKRYADTEREWGVLLARHNTIITDIFGDNVEILIVAGDYNCDEPLEPHITQQELALLHFSFQRIADVDLFELSPEEYGEGQTYRVAYAETVWKPYLHDNLLKGIADGKFSAFFISPNKKAIAAPYDGGIDFLLKDAETRDWCREKYKDWLSAREDGL